MLKDRLVRKIQERRIAYGVVYSGGCGQCRWRYVGETGRTTQEMIKEHRRMVRNMSETSEIVKHMMETGHSMSWSEAKVLDREELYGRRIFKEAWWTKKLAAANRTDCIIDSQWNHFMENS